MKAPRKIYWLLTTAALLTTQVGCDDKGKKEDATKDEAKSSKDDGDKKKADGDTKPAAAAKTAAATAAAAADAAPMPRGGAAAHLPKSCDMVAHMDIGALFNVASIKTHLVPVLEQAKKKEPTKDSDKRFKAFLDETGIDPLKDIKQMALCVTDVQNAMSNKGEPNFAIIVSGGIKPGVVVPAMMKHAKKEKFKAVDIGGNKVLSDPKDEMFFGQASDGAIVFSRGKAAFEGVMGVTDAASSEYKIALDKQVSLVVPAKTVKAAMENGGKQNPFAETAKEAGRASVGVDANKGLVEIRVEMTTEKAAIEAGGVVKMLRTEATKKPAPPGSPQAMMMEVAKSASIDNQGKELVIKLNVPVAELDKAVQQMAANMSRELGAAPGAAGAAPKVPAKGL